MAKHKEKSSSDEMTFFEHIDELRPHLVRGAIALFVIMIAAFICKRFIIDMVLLGPQSAGFPTNRFFCYLAQVFETPELCLNNNTFNMVNTSMAGQFNLHISVSFWTALVLAIPYLVWELWQFIKPALTDRERRGSNMMVFYVSMCFLTGLCFGYFLIAPLAVNFLGGYTASDQITNMIDVNSYLTTVMSVSLSCGVVFLLPVLVYFLTRMGILTSAFMRRYRRHAIIFLALVSAVITPPDLFSMVLVILPLLGLYELSIRVAVMVERQKAANEQMVPYE